jgi:hypothetical protein
MSTHAKKQHFVPSANSPVKTGEHEQESTGKKKDPLPDASKEKGSSVTLPKVDSPTTPSEMTKQRIPPRVETLLGGNIEVTGKKPVTISIEGQSAENGTVSIVGENKSKELALGPGSHSLKLKGIDQTSPGKADGLKLVARQEKKVVATSNLFSVAAIPQNWSSTLIGPASDENPDYVGIHVMNKWESDSKVPADLDKVMRKEIVNHVKKTGEFATAQTRNRDYVAANTGEIEDRHRVGPRANWRVPGENLAYQLFVFKDERTGVADVCANNSGFSITRSISLAPLSTTKYQLHVSKIGSAVTIDPHKASAATANISEIYTI